MQAGVIAVQGTWPNTPPPSRTPRPPTASPRKWSRSGTRESSLTATCSHAGRGVDDHLAADPPRGDRRGDPRARRERKARTRHLRGSHRLFAGREGRPGRRARARKRLRRPQRVRQTERLLRSEDPHDRARRAVPRRVHPCAAHRRRGEGVEVLATVDGRPVAVRDGPVVATAFHPELTDDSRIHDLAFFPEQEVVA